MSTARDAAAEWPRTRVSAYEHVDRPTTQRAALVLCPSITSWRLARGGPEELPFPAADGAAPLPGPAFSRDVLLRYLDHGRAQLRERIATVDVSSPVAARHPHGGKTMGELYQVNLDHIREHGGQLLAFARAGT